MNALQLAYNELSSPAVDNLKADLESSTANSTKRAYQSDWATFTSYCIANHFEPLPASPFSVAMFLSNARTTDGRPYRPSTLRRMATTIKVQHKSAGLPDPTANEAVKRVLKSKARNNSQKALQAKAMDLEELKTVLATIPTDNKGLRDRVVLLLSFAGGFRRSELAALKVADVVEASHGYNLLVRKSKTDQEGKGHVKQLKYATQEHFCPVRTLTTYLNKFQLSPQDYLIQRVDRYDTPQHTGISGHAINAIIKGYFPSLTAHSARAGFVTEAHLKGASHAAIALQTGQATSTINKYIRLVPNVENNAVSLLF